MQIEGAAVAVSMVDCWLRAFQMLSASDPRLFFHAGYYCWNDRCKKCFMTVATPEGEARRVQACRSAPAQGDVITALPEDMSFSV